MNAFSKGIELFNSGKFWESHEAWEEVWLQTPPVQRLFFQGLIQVAAGLHQMRRGIYHGTVKHLRNARWKLGLFPDIYFHIHTKQLIDAIDLALRRLELAGREQFHVIRKEIQITIPDAKERAKKQT